MELAQSARQEDAPAPGFPPYKGLLFFDELDSERFFGREALTAQLVRHVMNLAQDASTRFLAVVGASGSGKSSLVRAGLAVALQRAGWERRVFTPTADPLRILAATLDPRRNAEAERVLVLVDQFEEVFTLCHDEIERIAFIDKLLACAQEKSKKYIVVIALRADFYPHCAQYPLLRQAVAAEQEYIGQMTFAELRRAIEEPARGGGWEFEPGLVDVMLQDLSTHGAHEPEPGALPLLSHALLATWERRRGRTFTLDGYRASGGVRGAIAETAESVFTDQLNQSQQEIAREVFLRLTELGEGTEDTRRRGALTELARQYSEAAQMRAVLNTLAEARLITLNEDSAEVAHEALIREWQRLHDWLTQDREGLLLHRHLTESAHEWEKRGRDPADLYRGARLAQSREWASTNDLHLNQVERDFIAASLDAEQHEALEREAQRQRELEAAQRLSAAERQRAEEQMQAALHLRRRAVYLSLALAAAFLLVLVAIAFARQASQNFNTAQAAGIQAASEARTRATAEAVAIQEKDAAQGQTRQANSRALSFAALNSLQKDPELSILLAQQALITAYTTNAEDALHQAVQASRVRLSLGGQNGGAYWVDYSPDGKHLATASCDGEVKVWDASSGQELISLPGAIVAYSPDGARLATDSITGTVRIYDTTSGRVLQAMSDPGFPNELTFSPDGRLLGAATISDTVKVWDVQNGVERLNLVVPSGGWTPGNDLAFTPDSQRLLTFDINNIVKLWEIGSGKLLTTTQVTGGFALSPDGRRLATVAEDNAIQIWDITQGLPSQGTNQTPLLTLRGHTALVFSMAFSPDGTRLASAGLDGAAKVWSLTNPGGQELMTLSGHTEAINHVNFSPDGKNLATASDDGTVRVWDITAASNGELYTLVGNPRDLQGSGPKYTGIYADTVYQTFGQVGVMRVAFSPHGSRLATASTDGTARLWDFDSGQELLAITRHSGPVWGVAFSPDGRYLATSGADNTVRVWDIPASLAAGFGQARWVLTGHQPAKPLGGVFPGVLSVAFSPDGRRLVSAGADGTARVWDLVSGKQVFSLRAHPNGVGVKNARFSPDGRWIATVTDGPYPLLKIWDAATGQEILTIPDRTDVDTTRIFGLDFSPDSQRLVTGDWLGALTVWDVSTGKEIYSDTGHTALVENVTFSPDGKLFASAGDHTVKLWDAATGAPVRTYTLPSSTMDVAFSPDSKYIVAGSYDGTATVFLVRLEDLTALAKTRLTRGLTTEECRQYLHVEACP